MHTKKTAKNSGSSSGKTRLAAMTQATFELRSEEIHESLDNAIDKIEKIESGKLNPDSAMAILEKIKIVQALLFTAERELEGFLQSNKF